MPVTTKAATLIVGTLALIGAGPAYAQQDPGANDPSGSSPSGAIYQLPVDSGRNDAAPRSPSGGASGGAGSGGAGTGAGTGTGTGTTISAIRSSNGFGTSPDVPGTQPASKGAGSKGGGTSARSSKSGGSGKGSGTTPPPGEAQIPATGIVKQSVGDGSASLSRSLLLIALGILVAAGLAAGVRLASRRQ